MAKRLFALSLSLLMLISVFAGCTPNTVDPTDPTKNTHKSDPTTVAPTTEPKVELKRDPIDITIVSANCAAIEKNNFIVQKVKELFNVNLEMKLIDTAETSQVQLMLNTGEMADCGWLIDFDPAELYIDEITRSIPDEMIRTYAPDYAALLDSDPLGWYYYKAARFSTMEVSSQWHRTGMFSRRARIRASRIRLALSTLLPSSDRAMAPACCSASASVSSSPRSPLERAATGKI